jgi:hypothetical protein
MKLNLLFKISLLVLGGFSNLWAGRDRDTQEVIKKIRLNLPVKPGPCPREELPELCTRLTKLVNHLVESKLMRSYPDEKVNFMEKFDTLSLTETPKSVGDWLIEYHTCFCILTTDVPFPVDIDKIKGLPAIEALSQFPSFKNINDSLRINYEKLCQKFWYLWSCKELTADSSSASSALELAKDFYRTVYASHEKALNNLMEFKAFTEKEDFRKLSDLAPQYINAFERYKNGYKDILTLLEEFLLTSEDVKTLTSEDVKTLTPEDVKTLTP